MTSGTKSVLFGCHNPILHGIWVLMAWRLEYKSWPKLWQIICIFVHDIGVWGRPYLSDEKSKKGHWKKGAHFAASIFYLWAPPKYFNLGTEAFLFIAGHCPSESGYPESKLFRADKRSWLIAPMWWLWSNYLIEGFSTTPPKEWKVLVAQNLKRANPVGSHDLYLRSKI